MYLFLFLGMSKVDTPPLTPVRSKEVWLLPFFLDGSRSSLTTRGNQLRGGGDSGKVCPDVPSTPKAESPGRLRLAALESGFSVETEIPPCSRVSRDGSRRPTPQIPKPAGPVYKTGVLTVAIFFPHRNWRSPLLASGPSRGRWARRPCHSLVGPRVRFEWTQPCDGAERHH